MSLTIRAAVLAMAASVAFVPATTATATAATGPDLRACHDGRCDLTLTRSVSFPVSSRFGITRLAISFDSSIVNVKGTGPGVSSQALLGKGASGSVNNIGVRVVSLSAGKAVLKLAPRN
ncbi:hypothetical protein ACWEPC_53325 [Nonomuraea sp. NPDC004297]